MLLKLSHYAENVMFLKLSHYAENVVLHQNEMLNKTKTGDI